LQLTDLRSIRDTRTKDVLSGREIGWSKSIARALLGQEASGAPNVARREKACCQNKFCAQSVQDQRAFQALRSALVCLESDAAAVSEAAEQPQAWGVGEKQNDGMRAVWL